MIRDFIKNNTLAFMAIILLIAGFIGFSTYIISTRSNKQTVTVNLLPSDTKLLANDEQIQNGTAYLKPGTYTLKASRSGFKSVEKTVVISKPNTLAIDIALEPVADSAIQWKKNNEQLYLDYEGRAGVRATQEGESFTKLNPITTKVPFSNLLYTIGYRADPSDPTGNSIILTVDAFSGYRNAAINKIISLGYDPTNYKIEFKNYESPF